MRKLLRYPLNALGGLVALLVLALIVSVVIHERSAQVIAGLVGLVWGLVILRDWRRGKKMAVIADRWSLTALPGNSLPQGLTMDQTDYAGWTRSAHGYVGQSGGRTVAIFDLRKQNGRYSWWKTFVGIRTDPSWVAQRAGAFRSIQCGPWILLTETNKAAGVSGLTRLDRVEALLVELAKT